MSNIDQKPSITVLLSASVPNGASGKEMAVSVKKMERLVPRPTPEHAPQHLHGKSRRNPTIADVTSIPVLDCRQT